MSSKPSPSKSDPRGAPKDVMVTRHKSAQMKRQLRNNNRSMKHLTDLLKSPTKNESKNVQAKPKTPKIKDSLLKSVTKVQKLPDKVLTMSKMMRKKIALVREEEYHPNKVKRKTEVKKVMLKPSHNLQMVGSVTGSVKRKSSKPHKATSKSPKHAESPEPEELSMADVIRMVEDDLTDEDMMEILTCPSPVWWEDPPDEHYIEDAIFKQSPPEKETVTKKTEPVKVRKEVDVPSSKEVIQPIQMPNLPSKSENFLRKRSKLEILLGHLKSCDNKMHQSKKQMFTDDVVITSSIHRTHNNGDATKKTKNKDNEIIDKTVENASGDDGKLGFINKTKTKDEKLGVTHKRKTSNYIPGVIKKTKSSDAKPVVIHKRKSSNDKLGVINETESSDKKPVVVNKRRSSNDKACVINETKSSNDKLGVIDETESSDEKPGVVIKRRSSNDKACVIKERKNSDDKPGVVNKRRSSNDKACVIKERKNSDEKPGVVNKRKRSNDNTDVLKKTKSSNDKPGVINKTKSSDDKPDVFNETKSSNDKPGIINERRSSNEKPGVINKTKSSNDKPGVFNETKSSNDKPGVFNETKSNDDKPGVVNETKSSNDKPGVINEMKSSNGKPGVINKTISSDDKPVVFNETKSSDDKPGVINEMKSSNDKSGVINERKSSDDKPNVINKTKSSNDKPVVINETKSSNDKPGVISERIGSNDKTGVINERKSSDDTSNVKNKARSSSDDNDVPKDTKQNNDKRGRLSESDDEILFDDSSMNEDELLKGLENMNIPIEHYKNSDVIVDAPIENHKNSDVIVIDDDDQDTPNAYIETKPDESTTIDKKQALKRIFKPKKLTKKKFEWIQKNVPVSQICICSPNSPSITMTTNRETDTIPETNLRLLDEENGKKITTEDEKTNISSKDEADSNCVTVYKIIEEISDALKADATMETSKTEPENTEDTSATIKNNYKKVYYKKVYTKKSKNIVDKIDINKNDVNLKNDVDLELDVCESCKPKVKKVSDDENVKYCLKCSSIFDSTECTYCLEKSKAQVFTCTTCSKKFCCEKNYKKHTEHGAHHSNDATC